MNRGAPRALPLAARRSAPASTASTVAEPAVRDGSGPHRRRAPPPARAHPPVRGHREVRAGAVRGRLARIGAVAAALTPWPPGPLPVRAVTPPERRPA